MKVMQRIKIDEAKEGMTLAKPVLSEQGTTLYRESKVLNDGIIETLKKRDITRLKVEGHPVERPDEKPLDEILADVTLRFSKSESDPLTLKIRDSMIKLIKLYIKELNASLYLLMLCRKKSF